MGLEEYRSIQRSGRFSTVPRSMEGKWFATTRSDAEQWGTLFEPSTGPFVVICVRLPESLVQDCYHVTRLDGIGPAYFATMEQLANVEFHELE